MDRWGDLAAGARLQSFWLVREVVGVLVPGVALVVELLVVLGGGFQALTRQAPAQLGGSLAVTSTVLLLVAAWLVGYVARELAFTVLGSVTEPVARTADAAGRDPAGRDPDAPGADGPGAAPTRGTALRGTATRVLHRAVRALRRPHPPVHEHVGQLRRGFGDDAVDAFLDLHPYLARLLQRRPDAVHDDATDPAPGAGPDPVPGADPGALVFGYCKRWLDRNAPFAAVTATEVEINATAASFFPLVVLPVCVWVSRPSLHPVAVLVLVVLFVTALHELVRSFRRLRGDERHDALDRAFEQWFMSVAESRAPGAGPSPAPSGPAAEHLR